MSKYQKTSLFFLEGLGSQEQDKVKTEFYERTLDQFHPEYFTMERYKVWYCLFNKLRIEKPLSTSLITTILQIKK